MPHSGCERELLAPVPATSVPASGLGGLLCRMAYFPQGTKTDRENEQLVVHSNCYSPPILYQGTQYANLLLFPELRLVKLAVTRLSKERLVMSR